MPLPYSTRFYEAYGVSGGPYDAFTIDSGYVGVIKCISIVHGAFSSISPFEGWVQAKWSLTKLVRVFHPAPSETTGFGGTDVFYGSWVVYAGDWIQVQQYTGAGDYFISGYKLLAS
jgi:hypothetical protein